MAEPPQSDKPDSPYQIAQKQRMHWRGGERSKSISIYFSFFSLELSLLIPLIFSEPNRLQIFALMRGCAFASNFISCESGRGRPLKLHSVKVYNGAWKVNTFCIQNRRAHLVSLSLWWSVFFLRLSGYRPLHFPKQTCRGVAHTWNNTTAAGLHSVKAVFFTRTTLSASCLVCW